MGSETAHGVAGTPLNVVKTTTGGHLVINPGDWGKVRGGSLKLIATATINGKEVTATLENLHITGTNPSVAEVRRMLPQKLFIHVDERIAVARLRGTTDSECLIDRSGFVMRPVRLTDGTVVRPQSVGTLPVLTGVMPGDVQVGKQAQSEQVYRALELLDRLQQASAGSMMEVDTVDLAKPRHLMLMTRQRTMVKFDIEDYAQQLRRLSAILTWATQRQKLVQSVDLTVTRGVPVAFAN